MFSQNAASPFGLMWVKGFKYTDITCMYVCTYVCMYIPYSGFLSRCKILKKHGLKFLHHCIATKLSACEYNV